MSVRSAGVAAVLVLSWSISASASVEPPVGEPGAPTVEIVQNIEPGTRTFGVEGHGWQPDTLVQLELCGNNARSGTVDCVPGAAHIVASNRDGVVRGRVSTTPPPSPCPCVVRGVSLTTGEIATAPVRVPGVPELMLDPDDEGVPVIRELAVSARLVEDSSPWPAWFGASPRRTAVVTVANIGNVPIRDAVLSMTVGRTDPPTGFAEPVPLGDFDLGDIREIEVPVELPVLAWGEYHVRGEISGTTDATTFTGSTTSYPWLLVFIPSMVLLHVFLLSVRNVVRRRLARREPPDDEVPIGAPAPGASTPPPLAIGSGALAIGSGGESSTEETPDDSELLYVVEVNDERGGDDAGTGFDQAVLDRIVHEYHDERRNRSIFTVLGMDATKRLISTAVRRSDPTAVFPPGWRRGVIDLVAVPPIITADEGAIREAIQTLGRWLGEDLGLSVGLSSRPGGAGTGAVRLEAGIPTASYRLVLDTASSAEVDRFVDELRAPGVLVVVDHRADLTELLVRVHDVHVLHTLYERVAQRFPIRCSGVVGLLPLRMVTKAPKSQLDDLGVGPSDSYEYRIIAMAEPYVLAASRRSHELASAAG